MSTQSTAIDFESQMMDDNAAFDAMLVDAASAGLVEGKYAMRLTGAEKKEGNNGVNRWELEFKISQGQYTSRTVRMNLMLGVSTFDKDGNSRSDAELKRLEDMAKNQYIKAGSAVGLFVKKVVNGKDQYVKVPDKYDFRDCIDVECVGKVVIEHYDDKDGNKKERAVIGMFGLEQLTAESIKTLGPTTKKESGGGLPTRGGNSGGTKAAPAAKPKPKADLSGLV